MKSNRPGTSLLVEWLRLQALNASGLALNAGQGTRATTKKTVCRNEGPESHS